MKSSTNDAAAAVYNTWYDRLDTAPKTNAGYPDANSPNARPSIDGLLGRMLEWIKFFLKLMAAGSFSHVV
jgi:hypothetical protein